jgi:hypothetical protein
MGKQSIVQANKLLPDLGAPKLSYELIAYDDCTPPIYCIGIRANGRPTGLLTAGEQVAVSSPSRQFLREHCLRKGIPPYVAGAMST